MPLAGTGAALGAIIKANIDSLSDADKKDRDKVFEEMGKAIITHLTGPAGFTAVTVVSVSGVTTGPGVSGPGTGNLV